MHSNILPLTMNRGLYLCDFAAAKTLLCIEGKKKQILFFAAIFLCCQFMQTPRNPCRVKSRLATSTVRTHEDTFAINQASQSYPGCRASRQRWRNAKM